MTPTEDTPNQLDPDFYAGAIVCSCHDSRVKTLAPCYLCRNQTKDEQCYKCFKEGQQDDRQLREAIDHIFFSKYNDLHDNFFASEFEAAKAATEDILALFQKEQLQLVSEARAKAFRELPAVLSFNSNCNHCHANQLTIEFLGSDSPEGAAAGNDLPKYDPEADIKDTLRRKGEHKKQELERLQ